MWITTNWNILQEMGIPDHLMCLLRRLYAGQEARVRNRYGTTDWLKIGKGQYIMGNAGLNESQSGVKIARRNINNLKYSDDTALKAEIKEELKSLIFFFKSLFMKVKEEWKNSTFKIQHGLKFNIQKQRSWRLAQLLHGK